MAVTNVNLSGKAKTAPMTPTINTTPLPQSSNFNGGSVESSGSSWLTSALNAVGNIASSTPVGMLAKLGTSLFNNWQENKRAAEERAWNEQMMDKQNQWSLDMWNKTNEYNSPVAQVQRMQEAGLNPLFYGLDGSSAQGLQSAQALGYQRASGAPIENPLTAALETAQLKQMQAATDKIKSETSGIELDNSFKEQTIQARVEGEKLANELTKGQIEKIKVDKDKALKEIDKLIEETKNEHEKRNLIAAQTAVQRATEKQIVEMLPLQKLLVQAQTEAQKAAAAASFAAAAYQNKLIESGYIDEMLREAKAKANSAEALAGIKGFENAIKSGHTFTISDNDWWITRTGKQILNSLFQDISILGQLTVGQIKLGM